MTETQAAPAVDTAVADAPAPDLTVETFDKAAGDAWEQGSDLPRKADVAGPEAKPQAPAGKDAKPAPESAAAWTPEKLQAAGQEITQWHQQATAWQQQLQGQFDQRNQQLTQREQQIQQILDNPAFKSAYAQAQGGQPQPPQPGQAGAANADRSNSPGATGQQAAKPWEKFVPETENEKALVSFLDSLYARTDGLEKQLTQATGQFGEQLKALPGQFDQRLKPLEQGAQERIAQALDAEASHALEGLKASFPDLIDGGKNQEQLEYQAADLLQADQVRRQRASQSGQELPGEPLTLEGALKKAANLLGFAGHEERLRKQLQSKASAAASARTESATRTEPPAPPDYEALSGAAWEAGMAR